MQNAASIANGLGAGIKTEFDKLTTPAEKKVLLEDFKKYVTDNITGFAGDLLNFVITGLEATIKEPEPAPAVVVPAVVPAS